MTVGKHDTVQRVAPVRTSPEALEVAAVYSLGGQAKHFWGTPDIVLALAALRAARPVPAAPTRSLLELLSQTMTVVLRQAPWRLGS